MVGEKEYSVRHYSRGVLRQYLGSLLDRMKKLVVSHLDANSNAAKNLKAVEGIAGTCS